MPRVRSLAVLGAFSVFLWSTDHARALAGQAGEPEQTGAATGLIVGQVIDAGTGRPVANAIVRLTGTALRQIEPAPSGLGMPPPGLRVMTTGDGRFFFRGLRKGGYSIQVTKHGYLSGWHGARTAGGAPQGINLDEGERIGDAVITLWRYATISGTVVDEAGEPVVGIPVRAFRRTTVGGRRRFSTMVNGTTDDRGSYRIPALTPGDYVVAVVSTQIAVPTSLVEQQRQEMESRTINSPTPPATMALFEVGATPSSGGTPMTLDVGNQTLTLGRSAIPPPPSASGSLFVYPTTFYPAAPSLASAALVTVGSGEERTAIDLQLRPVRTASVSGLVTGPDGPASGIALHLIPAGSEEIVTSIDAAATVSGANGAFTFVAVPQGQYTLHVVKVTRPQLPPSSMTMIQSGSGMTIGFSSGGAPSAPPPVPAEPTLWAELPIAVSASDVTDVNVALRPGLAVSGRVEFEGSAPRPSSEQFLRIPVRLLPADPLQRVVPTPFGRVEANAQFRTYGVTPGRYFVEATGAPPPWMFKSATYEGRDIADVPLTLEASDATGVVLTFTDRPTELSGTVQKAAGGGDAEATVVIFPSDSPAWASAALNPRRMRSMRTSRTGTYRFSGLPSGEYYVAAIAGEAAGDWQESKYLETLSQVATQVRIEDGEKKTQDLKSKQ